MTVWDTASPVMQYPIADRWDAKSSEDADLCCQYIGYCIYTPLQCIIAVSHQYDDHLNHMAHEMCAAVADAEQLAPAGMINLVLLLHACISVAYKDGPFQHHCSGCLKYTAPWSFRRTLCHSGHVASTYVLARLQKNADILVADMHTLLPVAPSSSRDSTDIRKVSSFWNGSASTQEQKSFKTLSKSLTQQVLAV